MWRFRNMCGSLALCWSARPPLCCSLTPAHPVCTDTRVDTSSVGARELWANTPMILGGRYLGGATPPAVTFSSACYLDPITTSRHLTHDRHVPSRSIRPHDVCTHAPPSFAAFSPPFHPSSPSKRPFLTARPQNEWDEIRTRARVSTVDCDPSQDKSNLRPPQ